ncbi:MAG TPA: hypothetical protein VIV66_14145 [Pyrinomonadaceae bacterium]
MSMFYNALAGNHLYLALHQESVGSVRDSGQLKIAQQFTAEGKQAGQAVRETDD